MQPRKLDLLIATFSYGGNGGIASTHPDVMNYLLDLVPKLRAEPRIGNIYWHEKSDTPITMTRNNAVVVARQRKADLLLMIDSDMAPDLYLGYDPAAKPFWDEAFNFIYEKYDKGPHVVGAPYCGPPPHPINGGEENVYVFRWRNTESYDKPTIEDDIDAQIEQYSRGEAADLAGVRECAALPTGLILFDMRAFDLTEPKKDGDDGWFYYEWSNRWQSTKASTEDVTATRDISAIGCLELGYNPLYCAWNSWAGHWKPKCVGKPMMPTAKMLNKKFAEGVRAQRQPDQKLDLVHTKVSDEIDWTKAGREVEPEQHVETEERSHGEGEKISVSNGCAGAAT